jgi:hypothetical protein
MIRVTAPPYRDRLFLPRALIDGLDGFDDRQRAITSFASALAG